VESRLGSGLWGHLVYRHGNLRGLGLEKETQEMRTAKKYFISFVEEAIQDPKYAGYVGGRVEVTPDGEHYAQEEIRFFTNHLSEYYRLRDAVDFTEMTSKKLDKLRNEIIKLNDKGTQ